MLNFNRTHLYYLVSPLAELTETSDMYLIGMIALACFIPILALIIASLASDLPETIDPKLLELKPTQEPVYREKERERDVPSSDIV